MAEQVSPRPIVPAQTPRGWHLTSDFWAEQRNVKSEGISIYVVHELYPDSGPQQLAIRTQSSTYLNVLALLHSNNDNHHPFKHAHHAKETMKSTDLQAPWQTPAWEDKEEHPGDEEEEEGLHTRRLQTRRRTVLFSRQSIIMLLSRQYYRKHTDACKRGAGDFIKDPKH